MCVKILSMMCIGNNCPKKVRYPSKKLCGTHYYRLRRTGSIEDPAKLSVAEKNLRRRYNSMVQRCHNPNDSAYKYYGERGIKVCDSWRKSVKTFISDIGLPPTSRHSLDRINNDGNYEPGNVRWVLQDVQSHNQRTTNSTGYKGVYKFRDTFRTSIQRGGKRLYVGGFTSAYDAHIAYKKLEKQIYGS